MKQVLFNKGAVLAEHVPALIASSGRVLVEVHDGGASFVIDNFRTLSCYGIQRAAWKGPAVQKGQLEELSALATALQDGAGRPISLNDLVNETTFCFRVADLLR